jgi:hypothetical protein
MIVKQDFPGARERDTNESSGGKVIRVALAT